MARVAKSLDKLLAQLNSLFPNRSKVSDGSFADDRHKKLKSDHNANNAGVVTARDFTFDNNPSDGIGIDCNQLAKVLFANKDKRVKYIIWNRQITIQGLTGWKPYNGSNPHDHHLHLSVSSDPKLYDDASEWELNFDALPPLQNTKTDARAPLQSVSNVPLIKLGDKGEKVLALQNKLFNLALLDQSDIDGDFGKKTLAAVRAFQKSKNLSADGIVGAKTWEALGVK